MAKIFPKEFDSTSTIPSDDSSHVYLEVPQGDVLTISTIIDGIPRASPNKDNKANSNTITSRKWSPKETIYFYKLLEVVGTDFSIMARLQTRRTKR